MERLTYRTDIGVTIDKNEDCPTCSICWGCDIPPRKCNYIRDALEKLADYEDAEEQGLIPRFHLGDEFWTTRLDRVVKAKVVMLQQKKDGSWKYRLSREISSEYHDTIDFEESDYGKYFFSEKEEAEQKLASMQKGE